jgi:hypothetical protein
VAQPIATLLVSFSTLFEVKFSTLFDVLAGGVHWRDLPVRSKDCSRSLPPLTATSGRRKACDYRTVVASDQLTLNP